MINYSIEEYFTAYNIAYKDIEKANSINYLASHKGESTNKIYVIIENGIKQDKFIMENNEYHYFDTLEQAIEEIEELQK